MKTAVVIPTFNQEDFTIRCIASIAKNAPEAVIYWVDNGSDKASRQKVQTALSKLNIDCRQLLFNENLGFVKGVNAGLAAALKDGFDYFVIQNNDTEVNENWLEPMIKVAENDKKIGMVGPISNSSAWQIPEHLPKFIPELGDIPAYEDKPAEYAAKVRQLYGDKVFILDKARMLSFFSVLIKREVIEKVGVLSEDYGVGYGDDDDYSMRVKNAGYLLALTPGVFVFHNHKTTFKSIYSDDEIKKMQTQNLEVFKDKHGLNGRSRYYKSRLKRIFRGKDGKV